MTEQIFTKESKTLEEYTKEELFEIRYKSGVAMARKEAKQEGRLEGRLEGKEENQREVAINMLEKGLPLELIADCVKLSVEEIKALKNN